MDKLILKAITSFNLNILDCDSSNAPICSSSAMIVMHRKFLKQYDKSITPILEYGTFYL